MATLQPPPTAHITGIHTRREASVIDSPRGVDNDTPPHYEADQHLPSYNDPTHNFPTTAAHTFSPSKQAALAEALDIEANGLEVPRNSLDNNHPVQAPLPRRSRRARICGGLGAAVIILAVVLFFAGLFWPRHGHAGEQQVVLYDDSVVRGDEGVVFRREEEESGDVMSGDGMVHGKRRVVNNLHCRYCVFLGVWRYHGFRGVSTTGKDGDPILGWVRIGF